MSNVTNILTAKAHLTGSCVCLACDHKWQAVAPVGVYELECPNCKTMRGVYNNLCSPKTLWECACGSEHFFIQPNETDISAICAKCGDDHEISEVD